MPNNTTIRYKLRSNAKTLLVMYLIVLAVAVLLFASFAVNARAEGDIARGGVISIGGLGMASAITMLVIGTTVITEDLPLLLSCGISRKTQFRSQLIALLATVLGMAALEMAFSLTASLFAPYRSMFMQIEGFAAQSRFGMDYVELYQASTIVTGILWTAMLYALTFSIGFFFAAMFKRVPSKYKPYSIVGTVLVFLWGLPKLNEITNGALSHIMRVLMGETAMRHTIFFFGCAACLLAIGYVLFRRAQIMALRK